MATTLAEVSQNYPRIWHNVKDLQGALLRAMLLHRTVEYAIAQRHQVYAGGYFIFVRSLSGRYYINGLWAWPKTLKTGDEIVYIRRDGAPAKSKAKNAISYATHTVSRKDTYGGWYDKACSDFGNGKRALGEHFQAKSFAEREPIQ